MLVWLASFPRSGNTLVRLVLKSVYGVGSSAVYAGEAGLPMTSFLAAPTASWEPRKTHELAAAEDGVPAIYVIRDGRDSYVSYAHFVKQVDPGRHAATPYADLLRALIPSPDHFGGWSTHVEAWTGRAAGVAIVRFEELIVEPAETVAAACAQLGLELGAPTGRLPAPDRVRALDPHAFRKGRAGAWLEEMPEDVEDLFWRVHGRTMTRVGYER